MPDGDICTTYTAAPDLAAWEDSNDAALPARKKPEDFVSIHTSQGFVGYLDAPKVTANKQNKKQKLLSVEASDAGLTIDDGREIEKENEEKEEISSVLVPLVKRKKKFRRCCARCEKKFTEFVPWVHHNCGEKEEGGLRCKICAKEYQDEKGLFGHCSASLGK